MAGRRRRAGLLVLRVLGAAGELAGPAARLVLFGPGPAGGRRVHAVTFYRWYLLVWAQDFPFTLKDAVRLSFIGYACDYLGPGATGGDIIRAGLIATEQKSRKGIAMAGVLLDRILGVQALFVVGAMTMFFQPPALLQQPVVQTYLIVLWARRRTAGHRLGRAVASGRAAIGPHAEAGGLAESRTDDRHPGQRGATLPGSRSRAGLLRGDQRGGPHRHAVGILLFPTGCKSGAGSPGVLGASAAHSRHRAGCRLYSGTGGDRHDGEARRELLRAGRSTERECPCRRRRQPEEPEWRRRWPIGSSRW